MEKRGIVRTQLSRKGEKVFRLSESSVFGTLTLDWHKRRYLCTAPSIVTNCNLKEPFYILMIFQLEDVTSLLSSVIYVCEASDMDKAQRYGWHFFVLRNQFMRRTRYPFNSN